MITLTEKSYILGVWFSELVGIGSVLAYLVRDESNHTDWKIIGRLRMHSGTNDPFDGSDRKQWFEKEIKNSNEEEAKKEADDIFVGVKSRMHHLKEIFTKDLEEVHDFILVQGGAKKLQELMIKKPWAHFKVERNNI